MKDGQARSFNRIAIVNRGEPAMRLLRAVRDWNTSRGESVETVAFYTDPDRDALYVREADHVFCLGSGIFQDERDLDENGAPRSKSRYLDYARLREGLLESQADAAWVGWGFVAEHAAFADLCDELGVTFIGPSPAAMRRLGDKIGSKQLAEAAGVPVAPWSGGPVETLEDARHHAERIGFPLLVKATAGGGGRGIRFVHRPEQLEEAFLSASAEARKAFGDGTVFLESLVGAARHVEVQVLGDHHGRIWAVGTRDCSAQRCNQKVIEEAPASLPDAISQAIQGAAVRVARAANYVNAGTAEFLYEPGEDAETGTFYFMEMNTRLQVEHPVTEEITGLDLVQWQLAIARGEALPETLPSFHGHAIEVRVCAEDPARGFTPAPGKVVCFRPALGPGVRTDSGIREGETIPLEFDSMIAKIIVSGSTREQARARLVRALRESLLVIEGGTTNRAFLLRLLQHPDFINARIDTGWIDRLMSEGFAQESGPHAWLALLVTAIGLHERQLQEEEMNFFASASRGRPALQAQKRRPIELRHGSETYQFNVATLESGRYRIKVDDSVLDVSLERDGLYESRVTYQKNGPRQHRIVDVPSSLGNRVEIDGWRYDVSLDSGGLLRASAPGLVLKLHVKEGDEVKLGDRLLALEAMKMEMPVTASSDGRIRKVLVRQGIQVSAGDPLLVFEPLQDEAAKEAAPRARLVFPVSGNDLGADTFVNAHRELCRLLLGFDLGENALQDRLTRWMQALSEENPQDFSVVRELLALYIDIEELFSRQYSGIPSGLPWISNEKNLHLYLRECHSGGRGLPTEFLGVLTQALSHYGVTTLEDSPNLRNTLVWLFRSHQNVARKNRVLMTVLQACLENVGWRDIARSSNFRWTLDRLATLTQESHPDVCEVTQRTRYELFDGHDLETRRVEFLQKAELTIRKLRDIQSSQCETLDIAQSSDRSALLAELRSIPFALMPHLAPSFFSDDPDLAMLAIEVMTHRLYRPYAIHHSCTLQIDGVRYLLSQSERQARGLSIISTASTSATLPTLFAGLSHVVSQLSREADTVADLFIAMSEEPDEAKDCADMVGRLAALGEAPGLSRVCALLFHPSQTVQFFTFVFLDGRWEEEKSQRGFHPMIAERLELWRLRDFDVKRLSTSEDLYLFHGRARQNKHDERFFVIAEVRDLHPVRNASGHVLAIPEIENALMEAFQAIRKQQTLRESKKRLLWNRVTVFVRPAILARREDLLKIVHRLYPFAKNLGLEKVALRMLLHEEASQVPRDLVISISDRTGQNLDVALNEPHNEPLRVLDDYTLKLVHARQRRLPYAYEIVKMLAPTQATDLMPMGAFEEFDLDAENMLMSVKDRAYGENTANLVFGLVQNFTNKHPEGMTRVVMIGDATRDLGALAEPECRRIIAAIDLAEKMGIPVDWFPISCGAKIAMDSGTENLDWTAAVLRRIILFTQQGGKINVVVDGINVGAQSYWNAEATMLMHTKGCLIMTPRGSMLLTGKRALDYSGGVSAEDNLGIGGFERVMGPNAQAQYHAHDLGDACHILMRHYEHTYQAPGEPGPRRKRTTDSNKRDIRQIAYTFQDGFKLVGDLFTEEGNPGRKKPFDIRTLLHAIVDQDAEPLERWPMQADADVAVVWDAHLGGWPSCLIGIESRPLPRLGYVPSDGPDTWSGGTLFPLASKKVARAINAASGNRPVVVIANLSGFDGSPESLRRLQLEYGAEIGRAVVNFQGPIIFCVVARYHGGAYVVFSKALNPELKALALSGSYASVIGGAPAAAVVFSEEARAAALKDPRVLAAERLRRAGRSGLKAQRDYQDTFSQVLTEKTREIAERFDAIHTVQRALNVGSLDAIIEAVDLRPALIQAIESGLSASMDNVVAAQAD